MISTEKPGSPEEMLEHFGTKGMKWGVRKKQETSARIGKKVVQLKVKRSEHKESKAKRNELLAKNAQTAIDQIKANPSKFRYAQRGRNARVKELEKYRDQRLKDAKDIRAGHLTDRQKKIVIGVAVTATILAAYGTYKYIDSGGAHRLVTRNVPLKKNDLLSRKMPVDSIMKEVVAPINPNYGALGTKNNCRRATFAYEMRRRGLDVKATNSVSGAGQHPTSLLEAMDSNAKGRLGSIWDYGRELKDQAADPNKPIGPLTHFLERGHGIGQTPIGDKSFRSLTPIAKTNTIFESLSKNPEGARGELGMKWQFGGAHSMAWEIIGGKPVIFDTQTATSYTPEQFISIAKTMGEVSSTRLDNASLNADFLKKWIRNVN